MRFLSLVLPAQPAPTPPPAPAARPALAVRTGVQAGSNRLFDSQNNGTGARSRRAR